MEPELTLISVLFILYLFVYVCVCRTYMFACICPHALARMYMCRGQRSVLNIFLYHPPPYFPQQSLLMNLELLVNEPPEST